MSVGVAAVGTTIAVSAAGILHPPGSLGRMSGHDTAEASGASAGASVAGAGALTLGDERASRGVGRTAPTANPSLSPTNSTGLPGVGPVMSARIPKNATQAILVTGTGGDAATNTLTLWQRRTPSDAWRAVGHAVAGHNGASGWTPDHRDGDLRSPAGVFTLTYAAGRLPDPGGLLPYEYGPSTYVTGGTFMGHPLAGSFDYLVDIDYNHIPDTPPSNRTRPLGADAGGDIWLHVDHGAPTHGCVSIPRNDLMAVIHWLDPAAHPVIVMGDAAFLAH